MIHYLVSLIPRVDFKINFFFGWTFRKLDLEKLWLAIANGNLGSQNNNCYLSILSFEEILNFRFKYLLGPGVVVGSVKLALGAYRLVGLSFETERTVGSL